MLPFKNTEEHQKWKAQRLAQQTPRSVERQLPAQVRPVKKPNSFKKAMLYASLAFVGFIILMAIYSNTDRIAPTPKATSPSASEESLSPSEARARISHKVEEALLQMGMDATVQTIEKDGRVTLNISALTVDRPFAHQFVSQADLIDALRKAGFTEILFVQCCGLEDEYFGSYDLEKGGFK